MREGAALIFHAGRSPFVQNVAMVAGGTVGAQAITLAFAPIITRLFGPEAFGLLGTFNALVVMLAPLAALSYPIAMVLPQEDAEAKGIARLSMRISVIVMAVVAAVLLLGKDGLLSLVGARQIGAYVWLLPLSMVFLAWLQTSQQWLIRKRQFRVSARVAVVQALILNSAKAGMGLIDPVASVLIVLAFLGNALQAAMLHFGARRMGGSEAGRKSEATSLWGLAKRYSDFAFYQTPQQFLNTISLSLPILMLSAFFGPKVAGFYVLGNKLLKIPVQLLGQSVGDVFFPRITQAFQRNENLNRLIFRATAFLAVLGIVPFALVVVFGPWMFRIVFGSAWATAGEYARWTSLWLFFSLLSPPSAKTFIVLMKQRVAIVINFASVVIRAAAILAGALWFHSALSAVIGYSFAGVLHNLTIIAVAHRINKHAWAQGSFARRGDAGGTAAGGGHCARSGKG